MESPDSLNPNDSAIFPISDLPDIRRVRCGDTRLLRKLEDSDPVAPDAEVPSMDAKEADFGFQRSTPEEGREFLRQSRVAEPEKDELAEFLE